jgi:glycosyltransferase involved in cell wall biosynthesis
MRSGARNKEKRKICFISFWPVYYIYSKLFNTLGEAHPELQLSTLFSEDYKGVDAGARFFQPLYLRTTYPLKGTPFQSYLGAKTLNFSYFLGLESFIKENSPDVIISILYYSLVSAQAYRSASRKNADFILMPEEKGPPSFPPARLITGAFDSIFGEKMLSRCKRVLPWTVEAVDYFSQKLYLHDESLKEKVRLFPAGIDLNQFYPLPRRKFRISGKLKILVVANFWPFKDHATLVEAVRILKSRNYPCEVSLLGSGPLKEIVFSKIKDFGLENYFRDLGRVPYSRMRDLYIEHDLLILPSKKEPIGMCVPEAMACGTPVITSTAVTRTYIKEGENALVFRAQDPQDLAEKIMLMDDNRMIENFGEKGAEHIRLNFDLKKLAEEFYNCLIN